MSRTIGISFGVTLGGIIYQLFLKEYEPSRPSHLILIFLVIVFCHCSLFILHSSAYI
ncbi:hypothetical protein HPT25_03545 [Bacillus sp. BRMEA1]|uniref:hypothetical protein n=1 Tax=Neobacillus endophyticus TaxID=2738405 RepID=UPI001565B190|nr:hypothetical protein [Neobacillus endophyticus]NRD76564.1 hypothetical protein [Neobacillus endophyticus]